MGRDPIDGDVTEFDVRAAGGVVWRHDGERVEVVLVHRTRYDDWTFPKGKVDRGETDEDAAWREVVEETGFTCELGDELPSVTYADQKGRSKIVRYWSMTIRGGAFEPNDEVDALEWVSVVEANRRLTYAHDCDVLAAFAAAHGAHH